MKKLTFNQCVSLAVSLMYRIKFLEEQMITSSDYYKESYRKEIEATKELLDIVNSNDLYADDSE